MLSVTSKPFMPCVVMVNVVMPSVIMLIISVIGQYGILSLTLFVKALTLLPWYSLRDSWWILLGVELSPIGVVIIWNGISRVSPDLPIRILVARS